MNEYELIIYFVTFHPWRQSIFWVYLLNLFTVMNVSRKMYFEAGLIVVQNI